MSTFGGFSLAYAVPSYGGAEVVRARRWRDGLFGPAVHLALFGPAKVQHRLIAAAEALAQARHDRVARIDEIGRHEGSLYAVAQPIEGLDLLSLLGHERARRAVPDVTLAIAVALALARVAAELLDRDVWAGARGAGISSLFAAGLRLDAVVLAPDGVLLRPLAGAADDPMHPTAYRAPEIGARYAPANAATDVFLVTQVLRAMCAGDADASSAPRLGRHAAAIAPILAAGLSPSVDERPGLHLLIERLAQLLREATGEAAPAVVIGRALAGSHRAMVPSSPPDPVPSADDVRAASRALGASIAWPLEANDSVRTVASRPAFQLRSQPSEHDGVDRVFTDEGEATPTAVRLEVGAEHADADETTQKLPARPSAARAPGRSASDPPWASGSDVVPVEDSRKRPAAAAPVATASEIDGGPTTEMRSPFDDDKTE